MRRAFRIEILQCMREHSWNTTPTGLPWEGSLCRSCQFISWWFVSLDNFPLPVRPHFYDRVFFLFDQQDWSKKNKCFNQAQTKSCYKTLSVFCLQELMHTKLGVYLRNLRVCGAFASLIHNWIYDYWVWIRGIILFSCVGASACQEIAKYWWETATDNVLEVVL